VIELSLSLAVFFLEGVRKVVYRMEHPVVLVLPEIARATTFDNRLSEL